MQKLDYPTVDIALPIAIPEDTSTRPGQQEIDRRLLVIVSDSEMDTSAAARRILEIVNAFKSPIVFLGLCSNKAQEPGLHRQLITLSAMIRDAGVPFELRIESGRDWLNLIRSNWRAGDVLVSFAGQRAGARQALPGPLLQSNFTSTVYVINAGSPAEDIKRSNWRSTLLAWAGSIGIVLGFFWLQVKIDQALSDWFGTVILVLSIPAEAWLVWAWNSLFG